MNQRVPMGPCPLSLAYKKMKDLDILAFYMFGWSQKHENTYRDHWVRETCRSLGKIYLPTLLTFPIVCTYVRMSTIFYRDMIPLWST